MRHKLPRRFFIAISFFIISISSVANAQDYRHSFKPFIDHDLPNPCPKIQTPPTTQLNKDNALFGESSTPPIGTGTALILGLSACILFFNINRNGHKAKQHDNLQ